MKIHRWLGVLALSLGRSYVRIPLSLSNLIRLLPQSTPFGQRR